MTEINSEIVKEYGLNAGASVVRYSSWLLDENQTRLNLINVENKKQ